MIIKVSGVFAAMVISVRPHPNGDHLWLANIVLDTTGPSVQVVFGGEREVKVGDFVPFAPPGAKITVRDMETKFLRVKKMRPRNYRRQRSYGMLCSFNELGWSSDEPDEVPILFKVRLGQCLDNIPKEHLSKLIREWQLARLLASTPTGSPFDSAARSSAKCADEGAPVASDLPALDAALV